ncbi:MAG: TetR/AcrR family transcriptional regulator [Chitinophagaceae bacterium]
MGITERRIRQKDGVRSSILETAWKIVREEGWQALSIRKIADAIEYSVPVVYDHFENKEAILLEFGKQGFDLLAKLLQEAKDTTPDPAEQLRRIADAYWNFAATQKEYYQIMYGVNINSCETGKCLPEKEVFRNMVMDPLSRLLAENPDKRINACLKYHTYWSVMHGLISIKMLNYPDVADELNKLVLEDAINGFIKNLRG